MLSNKSNIIDQLQKAILPLQGVKSLSSANRLDIGFRPIELAFPNNSFPTGAMHEFISEASESAAATNAFVAALLSRIINKSGICLWVSSSRTLFPAAMEAFGITPHRLIFIDVKKDTEALWAMEEALKCERLAAVVGEIRNINLTASRKLQLAVEKSKVTGFILRHHPPNLNPVAAVSRWKINSLPSKPEDGLPGVGFTRWNVELLKVRNGKPGSWQIEWAGNQFQQVIPADVIEMPLQLVRQTG